MQMPTLMTWTYDCQEQDYWHQQPRVKLHHKHGGSTFNTELDRLLQVAVHSSTMQAGTNSSMEEDKECDCQTQMISQADCGQVR